jgi:hypothetical protein
MSNKHGTSTLLDAGTSALVELVEEIDLVAAEGDGEVIEDAVLTQDDLQSYYDDVERVVEAQQIADDDATQLLLR